MQKISLFCTKAHATCSGLTSLTVRLGVMVSPSISHRNCFGVRVCTSEADRGHWNFPCSSLLYRSKKPSFSQTSPLIRSVFRPQNRYRVSGTNGLFPVCCSMMEASLSIPDLRSVYPQTM